MSEIAKKVVGTDCYQLEGSIAVLKKVDEYGKESVDTDL